MEVERREDNDKVYISELAAGEMFVAANSGCIFMRTANGGDVGLTGIWTGHVSTPDEVRHYTKKVKRFHGKLVEE